MHNCRCRERGRPFAGRHLRLTSDSQYQPSHNLRRRSSSTVVAFLRSEGTNLSLLGSKVKMCAFTSFEAKRLLKARFPKPSVVSELRVKHSRRQRPPGLRKMLARTRQRPSKGCQVRSEKMRHGWKMASQYAALPEDEPSTSGTHEAKVAISSPEACNIALL